MLLGGMLAGISLCLLATEAFSLATLIAEALSSNPPSGSVLASSLRSVLVGSAGDVALLGAATLVFGPGNALPYLQKSHEAWSIAGSGAMIASRAVLAVGIFSTAEVLTEIASSVTGSGGSSTVHISLPSVGSAAAPRLILFAIAGVLAGTGRQLLGTFRRRERQISRKAPNQRVAIILSHAARALAGIGAVLIGLAGLAIASYLGTIPTIVPLGALPEIIDIVGDGLLALSLAAFVGGASDLFHGFEYARQPL